MVNVSLGSLMAIQPSEYFYECLDAVDNYDDKWNS